MKCSAVMVNGEWRDVFKDPITDPGKQSKKGLVKLWKSGSQYASGVKAPTGWHDRVVTWECAMHPVYRNGVLLKEITLDKVRTNSAM